MKARIILLSFWLVILIIFFNGLAGCRRSGEVRRAAVETTAPWTLILAEPIDHLDVVAREPMIVEHPDGSLFVGGFGASRMKENRTDELTLWKSRDGGANWARVDVGPDAPRAQGAIGNSDVDLAVAPDGALYFVTLFFDVEKFEGRQVSVGVSKDAGATWKWTLLSKTRFDDRPWVKVTPDGTAHVIWNDGAGVCHAVSQDGGMTWTERDRVHPQGGSSHMAMGPSGEMAVRITPVSASGNRYDEGVDLIAVSIDGGTTWRMYAAPGVRDWAASDEESIPRWVEPLAWDAGGALFSLWTGAGGGGVWLARSADQGKTWTTWRVSDGPEPAFFPYLVARGPGELAATWFSARQEVVQAHAARINVGEDDAPPRVVESRLFEPDCWQEGRRPDDPPLRYAGGEYLAVLFLHNGGLAVVSPIENRRDKRFGFSFWKLEEHRGGSRQKAEGQSQQVHPLLGTGRRVDHIGIGVRDLEKAVRDYEEVLGFRCTEKNLPSMGGRALLRRLIFFEDETLLEFLSPSPDAPATGDEFREWVEKHEGGMSLALRISSAQDAAAYLEAHNFEVKVTGWPRSTATEGNPAQVQYYSVTTPDAPSGNRQVFMTWIWLVEYVSSPERTARRAARREQGMMVHPNAARRLHSVWFAVRDMEATLKNIQDAGFEPGETREANFLGAKGREVKAGDGYMLLLQSIDKNGVLANFLSDHHDGEIIGVSIEVSDVEKARTLIESRSGHKLEPYDGFYGRSILIPPDMTHGVWMEFFQR